MVAFLSSAPIRGVKSGASMSMFWAAGRCPLAYSAGVRTSSTIVPGAFMAVEKPLAVMCCPVAGHVVLPADLLEEQAPVSYTHLRAHETVLDLVCRLLLEKKKK